MRHGVAVAMVRLMKWRENGNTRTRENADAFKGDVSEDHTGSQQQLQYNKTTTIYTIYTI